MKGTPRCLLFILMAVLFLTATWSTTAARLSRPAPATTDSAATLSAATPSASNLIRATLAGPFSPVLYATVTTDKPDYFPGETVHVTGSGWQPGETVELKFVETPEICPVRIFYSVADAEGDIVNDQLVLEQHDLGAAFTLTATGLSSGLVAEARFTDAGAAVTDFRQSANDDNPLPLGSVHWINSILQQNNSVFFEGMSTLQRLIFTGIDPTGNNVHTLTFRHQATKGTIHAYDYLTSWEQAVAAANAIAPGQGLLSVLNECGDEIGPPGNLDDTCEALRTGPNMFAVDAPDNMGSVAGDNVAASVAAYEAVFGNRTIKIFGNSPITAATLTFNGYTAGNDQDAQYTLTWTSASTEILIQFAGHIAVGTDNLGANIGYGPGRGASSISGGPYHIPLDLLDGASLGNQDNQIKGADILIPCPTCDVSGPSSVACGTTNTHSVAVNGICTDQSILWSVTGNGTIVGSATGTSVQVQAGNVCNGSYTVTSTITCDNCEDPIVCSQTVSITDTTPPQITCPAGGTFQCVGDIPAAGGATATDNCDTNVTITPSDGPLVGGPCGGTVTRTYTATDDCGNTATCTQVFTINDTTPPVLSGCPTDMTIQCISQLPAPANVTATDNCDGAITPEFTEVQSNPGSSCNNTITRTWTARDTCGNSATCTQVITVNDTTNPVLSGCPTDASFQCISQVPAPANVTATDNCDGAITPEFTEVQSNPGSSCNNTITRTWTARDTCGNSATCTQVITVNDTTDPVITCPANITRGACNNVVNFMATATDNCDPTPTVVCTPPSGTAFPVGATTVTCTATDDCSNDSSCSFMVTVVPGPSCDITPVGPVECGSTGNTISATVSGAAPLTLLWTIDDTAVMQGWAITAGQGTNSITFTAGAQAGSALFTLKVTDMFGCMTTCTATVECLPPPQMNFCSLTQGAYGNAGGKFNGIPRLELIQSLLCPDNPLVVGKPGDDITPGRSLTIDCAHAQCIIDRLPAGGPPSALPSNLGDATLNGNCQTSPPLPLKKGKWNNVLLGQVVTLSLNVRLDDHLGDLGLCTTFLTRASLPGPDGLLGTMDDLVDISDPGQIFTIPSSVITALCNLGLPLTVDGLLELANCALAGQPTGGASLSDINAAVDAINQGFDECRFLISCTEAVCPVASLPLPNNQPSVQSQLAVVFSPFRSMAVLGLMTGNRYAIYGQSFLPVKAETDTAHQRLSGLLRPSAPLFGRRSVGV